jgi:methionine salvage enolase-phosphatase E1
MNWSGAGLIATNWKEGQVGIKPSPYVLVSDINEELAAAQRMDSLS